MLHRLRDSVTRMSSVCHCGCPGGTHRRSGCTLCDCRRFTRWPAHPSRPQPHYLTAGAIDATEAATPLRPSVA